MGCVFPGATDLARFWRNIVDRVDMTRDVPAGRWVLEPGRALSAEISPDKVISLRGCYVEDFTLEPDGLDLSSDLLQRLDPLYQFVLHAGRAAMDDAVTTALDRARVGVILAAIALPTDGSSSITRETLGADFERRLLESAPVELPRGWVRTKRHIPSMHR
ncbi:MAG: hypothetical protein IPK83_01960 [Planctomycetes bacterium]|nr:hypothetical protein [Planctomycetota bacterium]